MTLTVVPFKAWHLDWLEARGVPKGGWVTLSAGARVALEAHNTWTALADGEPIACGGTVETWFGRHLAWIFLNDVSAEHMLFVTRAAIKQLAAVHGRIELTVQYDFEAGHRWARMLDFEVETPNLRLYGPGGEDHVGYVRFN